MGRFADAVAVYACQSRAAIARHEVAHDEFRQYCRLLKRLEREGASSGDDAIWTGFLRHLKRFRFRLLATPAPFGHPGVLDDAAEREVTGLARHATHLYPGQAPLCEQLVDLLKGLRRRNDVNPIFSK